MIINTHHLQILSSLKNISRLSQPNFIGFGLKYCGTPRPGYHLDTASHKQIIKDFTQNNSLNLLQFTDLVTSLYTQGESFDEIILAGRFPGYFKNYLSQINPKMLDIWLNYTHGWAEIDTLCQMNFTDLDLLTHWPQWQKILKKFNQNKNISKRRASLVLLTKPVRLSKDHRLSNLAFENIENLKLEKDILITKAVSWILRSLIKHHSTEVKKYLKVNQDTLPKIAIREATSKLVTGKKN